MKRLIVFVVLAMLLCAAVAYAGPLTSDSTVSYTDETGAAATPVKDSGFGVSLAYSSFHYKLDIPTAVVEDGQHFDINATGPMLTAEFYKLNPDNGSEFVLGAWWAFVRVDGDDGNLANIYGRYRFNKNWGVELGSMIKDARTLWGKTTYYATYEPTLDPKSNLALQFGIGSMTDTKNWMNVPGVTVKTKYSAYGNATWAFKNNMTANVGLWLLSQKYETVALGKFASSTTYQWTAGVGYKL